MTKHDKDLERLYKAHSKKLRKHLNAIIVEKIANAINQKTQKDRE